MASARLVLSRAAEGDLDSIFDYTVETFGPDQAVRYTTAIRDSALLCAEFPGLGRTYATRSGRQLQRYNAGRHVLFFVAGQDEVLIVRILHSNMDFDRHL